MPSQSSLRKPVYRGDPLGEPPPVDLAAILSRHQGKPDALITALEEMQRHYGYLAETHLRYLARDLGFPLARIFGIATFYNYFRLAPPGEHVIHVCRGTACHVNHSQTLLAHLGERLGVDVGETTDDRRFTLQTVACVGACSLAPVLVVDDTTHGRMTPSGAWEIIAALAGVAPDEHPVQPSPSQEVP